jgi:hypothetical protein
MKRHLIQIAVLLLAFGLVWTPPVVNASDPHGLIVHEWGTFTSIAGQDGRAVEWLPQSGPADLPCFVQRNGWKSDLAGTVRMETPVLYFYAPHETIVGVNVRFPQGVVTEWFPPASNQPNTTVVWRAVKASPGTAANYPVESTAGHYYIARQTDATPLRVGDRWEKFLFYRGVGRFAPPIAATVAADGRIAVSSPVGQPLGDIMLFENRGGAIAYESRHSLAERLTLDPLSSDGESVTPHAELERMLVANGLYPREARAMVDTWRDSWFEEGARLFYVVPREAVDSILPLEISPTPAATVRVFMGRVELVTAATRRDVARAALTNDRSMLARYERFLRPIGTRILADASADERAQLEPRLQRIYSSRLMPGVVCN